MRDLRDLRIEFERWIYRIRMRRSVRRDNRIQCRYIRRANRRSRRTKKQLWVLRADACEYYIYTKPQVKAAVRSLHLGSRINIHQTNEHIVHITQKRD
jgi:hypothetical protein